MAPIFHVEIRKSVKAAMVLLPLLGITNALVMIKAPLDRSAVEFALWSYSSHFLTSFQGFFVALLYCFLNGEVYVILTLWPPVPSSCATFFCVREARRVSADLMRFDVTQK